MIRPRGMRMVQRPQREEGRVREEPAATLEAPEAREAREAWEAPGLQGSSTADRVE